MADGEMHWGSSFNKSYSMYDMLRCGGSSRAKPIKRIHSSVEIKMAKKRRWEKKLVYTMNAKRDFYYFPG